MMLALLGTGTLIAIITIFSVCCLSGRLSDQEGILLSPVDGVRCQLCGVVDGAHGWITSHEWTA